MRTTYGETGLAVIATKNALGALRAVRRADATRSEIKIIFGHALGARHGGVNNFGWEAFFGLQSAIKVLPTLRLVEGVFLDEFFARRHDESRNGRRRDGD